MDGDELSSPFFGVGHIKEEPTDIYNSYDGLPKYTHCFTKHPQQQAHPAVNHPIGGLNPLPPPHHHHQQQQHDGYQYTPQQYTQIKQESMDVYDFVDDSQGQHFQNQQVAKKRGRKKKSELPPEGVKMEDGQLVKQRRKFNRFNGMPEEEVLLRTLPDHLAPNLDIVIIGINPGLFAAYKGHHYAGPGNHFWKCLYLSGLIPEPMSAIDDHRLQQYGIGFTNIVARTSRGSADLSRGEIKRGAEILIEKLKKYKPKIAVFNGKGIYEVFCGKKDFCFGWQPEPLEGSSTSVFVMPSSSARCAQLPRAADKVPFYKALKRVRDHLKGNLPDLDPNQVIFPDVKLGFPSDELKKELMYNSVSDPMLDAMHIKPEPLDGDFLEKPKRKRGRPKKKREPENQPSAMNSANNQMIPAGRSGNQMYDQRVIKQEPLPPQGHWRNYNCNQTPPSSTTTSQSQYFMPDMNHQYYQQRHGCNDMPTGSEQGNGINGNMQQSNPNQYLMHQQNNTFHGPASSTTSSSSSSAPRGDGGQYYMYPNSSNGQYFNENAANQMDAANDYRMGYNQSATSNYNHSQAGMNSYANQQPNVGYSGEAAGGDSFNAGTGPNGLTDTFCASNNPPGPTNYDNRPGGGGGGQSNSVNFRPSSEQVIRENFLNGRTGNEQYNATDGQSTNENNYSHQGNANVGYSSVESLASSDNFNKSHSIQAMLPMDEFRRKDNGQPQLNVGDGAASNIQQINADDYNSVMDKNAQNQERGLDDAEMLSFNHPCRVKMKSPNDGGREMNPTTPTNQTPPVSESNVESPVVSQHSKNDQLMVEKEQDSSVPANLSKENENLDNASQDGNSPDTAFDSESKLDNSSGDKSPELHSQNSEDQETNTQLALNSMSEGVNLKMKSPSSQLLSNSNPGSVYSSSPITQNVGHTIYTDSMSPAAGGQSGSQLSASEINPNTHNEQSLYPTDNRSPAESRLVSRGHFSDNMASSSPDQASVSSSVGSAYPHQSSTLSYTEPSRFSAFSPSSSLSSASLSALSSYVSAWSSSPTFGAAPPPVQSPRAFAAASMSTNLGSSLHAAAAHSGMSIQALEASLSSQASASASMHALGASMSSNASVQALGSTVGNFQSLHATAALATNLGVSASAAASMQTFGMMSGQQGFSASMSAGRSWGTPGSFGPTAPLQRPPAPMSAAAAAHMMSQWNVYNSYGYNQSYRSGYTLPDQGEVSYAQHFHMKQEPRGYYGDGSDY